MAEYRCVSVTSLNKKKYKVVLEGIESIILSLYPSELRRYKIEEGSLLNDDNLIELKAILYKRGKERALYYLKSSDKTSSQIKKKLKEGYYPIDIIDKIIDFLINYGYVDDVRYTKNYISYNGKKKSIINMRKDLLLKGIEKDVIDSVLDECDYDSEEQERVAIYAYCSRKMKSDMDEKEYNKFLMSLLRKGFKYEVIKSTVDTYMQEQNNFLGNF